MLIDIQDIPNESEEPVETLVSLAQAGETMRALLDEFFVNRMPIPGIFRLEVLLEDIDMTGFLAAQKTDEIVFWDNRTGSLSAGGVGTADTVRGEDAMQIRHALKELTCRLKSADKPCRYYGGAQFMPFVYMGRRDKGWESFGAYRFVLPRFEVLREDGKTTLACHIKFPESITTEDVQEQRQTLIAELSALVLKDDRKTPERYYPLQTHEIFTRDAFGEAFTEIQQAIKAGSLEKVVLARCIKTEYADGLEPLEILERLYEPSLPLYRFSFQFTGQAVFAGATPELLYRRDGRTIQTESLAGSRRRGKTPSEDWELGQQLLQDKKEVREHLLVTDHVKNALKPLCKELEIGKRKLLFLPVVQHLLTELDGELSSGIDDAQLLTALHPTPAVGGTPVREALQCIRDKEPFDRGWFAGPVGWVGQDSAEFAVGIRSALISNWELFAYAGAGIVAGSKVDSEWEEIGWKLEHFRRLAEDSEGAEDEQDADG